MEESDEFERVVEDGLYKVAQERGKKLLINLTSCAYDGGSLSNIFKMFPEAAQLNMNAGIRNPKKLGNYTGCYCLEGNIFVVNVYAQYTYVDSIEESCLTSALDKISKQFLDMPVYVTKKDIIENARDKRRVVEIFKETFGNRIKFI